MALITKNTPLDFVIETGPFCREQVRQMVRMTQNQIEAVKREVPWCNVRRATKQDYMEGLSAQNINPAQVLARMKTEVGAYERTSRG